MDNDHSHGRSEASQTEPPQYERCCCFRCELFTEENTSPDCGCESGPCFYTLVGLRVVCNGCPKTSFCDAFKNPENYIIAGSSPQAQTPPKEPPKCKHENTKFGTLEEIETDYEFCLDCGMSRAVYEQFDSNWQNNVFALQHEYILSAETRKVVLAMDDYLNGITLSLKKGHLPINSIKSRSAFHYEMVKALVVVMGPSYKPFVPGFEKEK